jgi:hypothetical protein
MEALITERVELYKKEDKLFEEYSRVKHKITETNICIEEMCGKSKVGHQYVSETENCQYGMTFTYCKTCGHELC